MVTKEVNVNVLFNTLTTNCYKGNLTDNDRKLVRVAVNTFNTWAKVFEAQMLDLESKHSFEDSLNDNKTIENKFQMQPTKKVNEDLLTKTQLMNILINQWFQCLVEPQTPKYADGPTRKSIRKKTWNGFIKGKYSNKEIREKLTYLFDNIRTQD